MTLDEVRRTWIPYRLQAIDAMQYAWELLGEQQDDPDTRRVQVLVDGRIRVNGNIGSIVNPMIDLGVIYARSLLEFLGITASNGCLVPIRRRMPGDIGIEDFSAGGGGLSRVEPAEAIQTYDGPREDAEDALVAVIELANRLVAHVTTGTLSKVWTDHHLDIACRGIPVLFQNHFFNKLKNASY